MTKTNKTLTTKDVEAIVATLVATLGVTPKSKGFIIYKTQNTSSQYFFSDHQPVDGIDLFGHSTKDTKRMVREAYKYDTFADALQDLANLIADDSTELVNNTVKALGIYDVAKDKSVFLMTLCHDADLDLTDDDDD